MTLARYVNVLTALCNLPTAPFCEEHVARWVEGWADGAGLKRWRDRAGNVYVEYVRGERSETPLVIEAHMDHPGFLAIATRDGVVHAEFRGGVKPSYFVGERVRFWVDAESGDVGQPHIAPGLPGIAPPVGRWVRGEVLEVEPRDGARVLDALVRCEESVPAGALGMWDLPDAAVAGDFFSARVCDDLAGCAAIVCMMEALIAQGIQGRVIGLFDRAEEVGFAGVLAVCENGWIPNGSRVIGLETSKPVGAVEAGKGVVVRVGDRTGLFSAGLTHFLAQAAGVIADDDSSLLHQRALMDGGMCNSTAFMAWGYDTAAMCLPLLGYHNMGTRIVSESIHLADFTGMVRVLIETAKRMDTYKPGFGEIRERLAKMHRAEHLPMLYETVARLRGT